MPKFNLTTVIAVTAFILAACAAYFSVSGIGKLLAGGGISILVFASAIELGKLVSVSFLYRHYHEIHRSLRWAFAFFSVAIMFITSLGIYGYLTSAYTKASVGITVQQAANTTFASQDTMIGATIQRKTDRILQLDKIRTQQEARLDNTISKTNTGTSRTITEVQRTIRTNEITEDKIKGEVALQTDSDLGPFLYIAKVFELPLDTVVKWFILVLVLVFDPLSICLVIAYNFLTTKKEVVVTPIEGRIDPPEPEVCLPDSQEMMVQEPEAPPIPAYMRRDFDWNNRSLWENDPKAVEFRGQFR
jgi:hypothetical protein